MKKQFKQIRIFNQISIPFSKCFHSTLRKHIHLVSVLILGIQQLEKDIKYTTRKYRMGKENQIFI